MTQRRTSSGDKGQRFEELLRNYFLKAGYFAVRGVPFVYAGFDVTDIDIWLYNRVSPLSRELSIVDIKSKKTPQAIERIFWTKGLQEALGVTRAIVATTDTREEVKTFGNELDVLVLDGRFLRRLATSSPRSSRLTEEEFRIQLGESSLGKSDKDWLGRIRDSKARLADGLSFDSCNYWLAQAHYFAEQVLARQRRQEAGLRCFYVLASFAVLAIDFCLRKLSFLEEPDREKILRDGFAYGARGEAGTRGIIDTSLGLVEQYADRGRMLSAQIRSGIDADIAAMPANILSQFFSKSETGRTLFEVAVELEGLGMSKGSPSHASASVAVRAVVGCLLDFWSIDRRKFAIEVQEPAQHSLIELPSASSKP